MLLYIRYNNDINVYRVRGEVYVCQLEIESVGGERERKRERAIDKQNHVRAKEAIFAKRRARIIDARFAATLSVRSSSTITIEDDRLAAPNENLCILYIIYI